MGLREVKAERLRQRILDVASDLFLAQGFAETSMEEIAARAEVGSTTLYRYFPSKDHLALGPLNTSLRLGDALQQRPQDEPLDRALGAVILGALDVHVGDIDRFQGIRRVMDSNPRTRAALWDILEEGRENLCRALAVRMGMDVDSTDVVLTSRLVFAIWELAWVRWANHPTRPLAERGAEVLGEVSRLRLSLPELPEP